MNKPSPTLDLLLAMSLGACALIAYVAYRLVMLPADAWGWLARLWRME